MTDHIDIGGKSVAIPKDAEGDLAKRAAFVAEQTTTTKPAKKATAKTDDTDPPQGEES